jgi:catechol 2,3-dioxygenase
LQVADLDRSVSYYEGVLGLRVVERGSQGRAEWVTLGTHPAPQAEAGSSPRSPWAPEGAGGALIELRERRGVGRVPPGGLLGLFHFAVLLPDRAALGRFLRHLLDNRVTFGAADHMVSEALYLTDPDGLGIEVYRDRPREQWVIRHGQVMGGTDPLDSGGVVAAAAGAPWAGVPEGSRIGHVHFHVADLNQASAYYHAALGFDRVRWSFPGALFVSAGGYHHHVGLNTWAANARPASDDDARLLEWELVLPSASDVEAARRSLEAARHPVARAADGFRSADPWGTAVHVRVNG